MKQFYKTSEILIICSAIALAPFSSVLAVPVEKSLNQNEISSNTTELLEQYASSGFNRLKKGDYRGAIEDFNKAIEIDPNNSDNFNNRGIARSELGDHQGAIEDYTRAIALDPNDAAAYSNRGNSKSKLKDYEGAISDYSKAIEIAPS